MSSMSIMFPGGQLRKTLLILPSSMLSIGLFVFKHLDQQAAHPRAAGLTT